MTRVRRRPAPHLALVRSVERWYFSLRRRPTHLHLLYLSQKSHRLLPTNLYVILYNFKSRHQDELDLKAGDKVTVIDFADPDWWKGKCLGRTGYFPSKYCSKLAAGERPLQVSQTDVGVGVGVTCMFFLGDSQSSAGRRRQRLDAVTGPNSDPDRRRNRRVGDDPFRRQPPGSVSCKVPSGGVTTCPRCSPDHHHLRYRTGSNG